MSSRFCKHYDDVLICNAGVHGAVLSEGDAQVFSLCVGVCCLRACLLPWLPLPRCPAGLLAGVIYTNAAIVEAVDTEIDEQSLRESR